MSNKKTVVLNNNNLTRLNSQISETEIGCLKIDSTGFFRLFFVDQWLQN